MRGEGVEGERYSVERSLGHGGMATVYLAQDRMLDRPVALKVLAVHLAQDEESRQRFLREARLAARLVHPNVVQVYDVGEDERGPFIVMEYVDGETLADALARRGRLPPSEVVAVGIEVCAALEAAHREGLVHRDIKPRNILRRSDGQTKLADFGIARSLTATSHTEAGTVLGTAAYLAPEQARGEPVSAAADIYALGVVLYELLTGRPPIEAETLPELVVRREQGAITPPSALAPEVPATLGAVVMRCLAPAPADRPESAAALARELAASIAEPVTAPLLRVAGTDARRRFSRRALIAAVAVAVLAASAIAIVSTEHNRGAAGPPATTTASTTSSNTTPTTTAQPATTTTAPAAPATPADAVTSIQATIANALAAGQLDPHAADQLSHALDEITRALDGGKSQDAAHKSADLIHRLGDFAKHGQIDSTVLAEITAQVQTLAGLLPSESSDQG